MKKRHKNAITVPAKQAINRLRGCSDTALLSSGKPRRGAVLVKVLRRCLALLAVGRARSLPVVKKFKLVIEYEFEAEGRGLFPVHKEPIFAVP